MDQKRPEVISFLNSINKIIPLKDQIILSGKTELLNSRAQDFLRAHRVSLKQRTFDLVSTDLRYINTASNENIDMALLTKYSLPTLSLILCSSYANKIQRVYRNYKICKIAGNRIFNPLILSVEERNVRLEMYGSFFCRMYLCKNICC